MEAHFKRGGGLTFIRPTFPGFFFLFRLMALEGGEDWLMAYGAVKNSINKNAKG
jgi:hypothetical protein